LLGVKDSIEKLNLGKKKKKKKKKIDHRGAFANCLVAIN